MSRRSPSSFRRPRRVAAAAALAMAAASALVATSLVVHAQVRPGNAAAAQNDGNNVGIFVRDSAVAAEKLALAERMERAKEWDTSAEVYQEVVDRFADRVISVHTDAQGRTDRYGGVATVVQDRIAAWPAEGQKAYLNRYEAPAARMLEGIDPTDAAALSGVINRYFVTTAGRDAAIRLVERYFEDGQFVAAASLADRLINRHPAVDASQKPLLLLRSALAWHLAGDAARANARANTLASDFADAKATLGGKEQSLSALANAELAHAPASESGQGAAVVARWTEPFGTSDHAAVARDPAAETPADKPREWARLLTIPLDPSRPQPNPNDPNYQAQQNAIAMRVAAGLPGPATGNARNTNPINGILPAIDGDALFFQDNARVYARSLATGAALPGWASTYPNDDGRYKVADAVSTPRGAQMSVTLAGRYVLAILGQPEPNAFMYGGGGMTRAQVVCLDRESGAVLWSTRMSEMPAAAGAAAPQPGPSGGPDNNAARAQADANAAAEDAESLRSCNPCGSVMVVNDAAYIVARGGRNGAIIDTFLVCLNLADGQPRWTRHLASGNSNRSIYGGFDPSLGQDNANSHLAYADGRIYACTDLGALAAIDAADGTVAWIAAYPKPRAENIQPWMNNGLRGANMKQESAFAGNPVIVRDGKLLTLPVDSEHLFVHDAFDGHEIARVRLRTAIKGEDRPDTADVLAGISGDSVVLASPRAVSVLDWKKLVPQGDAAADAPSRELSFADALVRRKLIIKPGYEDDAIRGRVCVTDRSIFVPTAWRLWRLDLNTLLARDQYPANDDWDKRRDEAPGNITVAGDRIFIAGPQRVSVFAELSQLREKLDAQIAAEPDNLIPRRQYAEALFNAGREDEALSMIDAATQKLGSGGGDHSADRTALFDMVMNRLREHATVTSDADQSATPASPESQQALLTRASALAQAPDQQVAYRLAAASVARAAKDVSGAVALYQAILDEPTWSNVRVRVRNGAANPSGNDPEQNILSAGKLAAQSIDSTMAKAGDAGHAAYAPIEAKAAAELDRARTAGPASPAGAPTALFAIARQYPNAKASKAAIALASAILTRPADGSAAPDRRALRELAAHAPDAASRVALSEALARSYLAQDDVAGALGRVRRLAWAEAARAFSGPLPDLADGTSLADASNAGAAVDRLQAVRFDRAEKSLPDLHASYAGNSFDTDHPAEVRNVARLLLPADLTNRGTARPGTRNDRVVALSRGAEPSLLILRPGNAEPIAKFPWTLPVGSTNSLGIMPLWLDNDQLLMRQPDRVACVDTNGAKPLWSLDVAALDASGSEAVATNDNARPLPSGRIVELDESGIALLEGGPATEAPAAPAASKDPLTAQIEGMIARGEINPVQGRQMILQQQAQRRQMAAMNAARARMAGAQVQINRRVIVNGQLVAVDDDGNVVESNGTWQPDPKGTTESPEQIVDARAVGTGPSADTVVVVTSRGRLIGVDRASGAVRWRANVADRTPSFVGVVDDRVVIATTDEQSSQLVVVDAADGSEALRQTFGDAQGAPTKRIASVAVSDEGFAVVLAGDTLTLFDIAGGDPEALVTQQVAAVVNRNLDNDGEVQLQQLQQAQRVVVDGNGNVGATGPRKPGTDLLQFCGGRLLMLSATNSGANEVPLVRAYDLGTLTPVTAVDKPTGQMAEQKFLPAYANGNRRGDEPITMRVHKDRLFIGTQYFFKSFPVLDKDQLAWPRTPSGTATAMSANSPMFVRDGVVLIGWPGEYLGGTSPAARLELYSREIDPTSKQEAGMLAEEIELKRRNARITNDAFQCVDGGIYYLATDGTLVFLPGKSGQ